MDNVNTEQILRYLEGEMDADEKRRFEESLSQNKPIADESHRLSLAIDAVKYYGTVEQVRNVHAEMKEEGSVPGLRTGKVLSMRKVFRYSMATAACVLFIFIAIKTFEFYSLSPDRLYSQAFVSYEMSASRGAETKRSDIEEAYLEKNYLVVKSFAKEKKELTMKESFLTGLSYMRLDEHTSAIPYLRKAAGTENPQKADAEFYLALSYLKDRDFDLAIALMEKIKANPAHPYHDRFSEKYIEKVQTLKWR